MPSAMSSPSEPVDTVSTSIAAMFLPSRMIEPLPKLRSICESAASRAFDLSMEVPSTRRSAALIGRAPYGRESADRQRTLFLAPAARPPAPALTKGDGRSVHDMFSVRNMFYAVFHR